jgi:hypothetical protein
MDRLISVRTSIGLAVIAIMSSGTAFAQNSNPPDTTVRDQLIVRFKTCCLEAAFISSQSEPRLKAEQSFAACQTEEQAVRSWMQLASVPPNLAQALIVRIKIDLKKIIVQ